MMKSQYHKFCITSAVAIIVAGGMPCVARAQEVPPTENVAPPVQLDIPMDATAQEKDPAMGTGQADQKAGSVGLTAEAENLKDEDLAPEVQILRKIERELEERKKHERYTRSSIPSLIFTAQQYALLREARVGFNTRSPTLQELRDPGDPNDPNYRRTSLLREVVLGGIAYKSPDDWTIWLNNARVTPDAIPADAVDLKVFKDFIELRWHDVKTDQIYPIRLRPNQKFNLDVHMFLPG